LARAVFLLVLLLPFFLSAQVAEPNKPGISGSFGLNLSTDHSEGFKAATQAIDRSRFSKDLNAGQRPNAKPHLPKPSPSEPGPKVPGSMVGYIDDAIVGSQVRMRVDAAFHNNRPDRAEFFYAQCNCIEPSGPGPNPLVADLNFQQLYLHAEYAPARRLSVFTDVPFRWIQPTSIAVPGTPPLGNERGVSDITVGFKVAALASSDRYLTFQFQGSFPSGNAALGLGTNHYGFLPELLYYQRVSERAALEAQVGDSHPIGGSYCPHPCNTETAPASPRTQSFAGDVFLYGVGPSYVLYQGENVRVVPVVEMFGWHVANGLVTDPAVPNTGMNFQASVSAAGTNIVNLKVGVRTMLGAHSSFYAGYGHQLTHAVWYKEIVRIEFRYLF
jgi:hypothetical protein